MARRRTARRVRPRRQWFLTVMIIGLIGIVALSATSNWIWYQTWYTVWTMVAFLLYGYDKNRAGRGARRVPEIVLHSVAWLGGAMGALLGMLVWRHKTRHILFRIGNGAALATHAALIWYGFTP